LADLEFTPLETMRSMLSRWWIVVIMAILGGLFGWAFQFSHSPVYEATANLTVTMDFSKHELTQYEEDYAFTAAGAIINSFNVQEQVLAEAQTLGITLTRNQLAQQMSSEGRQSAWELHIRDRDPQVAAQLVNLWVQAAYDALDAALVHAAQADQLQVQIDLLQTCISAIPGETDLPQPSSNGCSRFSLAEIQTVLQSRKDQLVQETEQSQGILSIMEFGLTGFAAVPDDPVVFDRAGLILAGTMIGFIISLWVTGSRKVRRSG
jgi:uncharacterized protein involved in exopolysaccharide biosynthesis